MTDNELKLWTAIYTAEYTAARNEPQPRNEGWPHNDETRAKDYAAHQEKARRQAREQADLAVTDLRSRHGGASRRPSTPPG